MKVLVYPHSMEIGGSQLNAVQIAAAVRDRGHEVIVISDPGPLVARVRAMGLEHIEISAERRRPSLAVSRMLGEVVQRRSVDVVHSHEWPPIIEAFLGVNLPERAAVVGTVMSMSVAPFLPHTVPLTVGTEMIRRAAMAAGHRHVTLLEPPVDAQADHPSANGEDFRIAHGIRPDEVLIVMICRLVPDLKLEGLLSACEAVGEMALMREPVRLMIIGDGPAHAEVAARSAKVNAAVGREVVVLTGEMADPRPGYAAADIVIGQGGSALRGLAFAKPLVVVGENGFSELLTRESAPTFLQQGWYGLGPGSRGAGPPALRLALQSAVASRQLRHELGLFGRRLVEQRFSLAHAAKTVEDLYLCAIRDRVSTRRRLAEATHSVARLVGYKLHRKYRRWVGKASTDDANDRSRIAAILSSGQSGQAAGRGDRSNIAGDGSSAAGAHYGARPAVRISRQSDR
ncbi:glycosyltransferase family 4 protein [Bradyrhizobium hereditatis]|uniref:glycosyltransferase family 4 protein n=1 Tax=Bradyrhizobium hereditatis TaxID=2821405 RepID=UPI001CE37653|nr:glycosyltransferase family 4 protein [Bradyrhizobium hereditatis]